MNIMQKEIIKSRELDKIKRYCDCCGAVTYVPKYAKKKICKVCGNTVYYDDKVKFEITLNRLLKRS